MKKGPPTRPLGWRKPTVGSMPRAEAEARLAAGETPANVARDAGVSRVRMHKFKRECGVTVKAKRGFAPAPLADVEAALRGIDSRVSVGVARTVLRALGVKTAREVAAETGLSPRAVYDLWERARAALAPPKPPRVRGDRKRAFIGWLPRAEVLRRLSAGEPPKRVAAAAGVKAHKIRALKYASGIRTPVNRAAAKARKIRSERGGVVYVGRLTVAVAVERMRAGEPRAALAAEAGVSVSMMQRIARRHRVPVKRPAAAAPFADVEAAIAGMKTHRKRSLVRAVLAGRGFKTHADLAAKLGVTPHVVLDLWAQARRALARLSVSPQGVPDPAELHVGRRPSLGVSSQTSPDARASGAFFGA